MEREKRIHYIDSFEFSFILPLAESYKYEVTVKTTGLNKYIATFEHKRHGWECKNCKVKGDEVTVFAREHKLAPGKVYCHVRVLDRHGKEEDCVGFDPHIFLTYDHIVEPKAPSDVDAQQSIDIINLFDKFHDLRKDVKKLEKDVDNKTAIYGKHHKVITEMFVSTEDENDPLIYTREQADARFATKDEMGNISLDGYYTKEEVDDKISKVDVSDQFGGYEKTEDVDKKLEKKADLKYVNDEFYNKAESDNKYLTQHQDLSDYLTYAELAKKLGQYQPAGDYLVPSDLGSYYNRAEVNELVESVDVREKLNDYALINNTTKVTDNLGVVQNMQVDLYDNDFSEEIYTRKQADERFAIKEETLTIDKLIPYVKNDYLNDYFYTKADCNNLFLTGEDCYSKQAVDALLRQVYQAIAEINAKVESK